MEINREEKPAVFYRANHLFFLKKDTEPEVSHYFTSNFKDIG